MKLIKLLVTAIAILALSSTALADHDCIEELPEGNKIVLENKFPDAWLTIGGKLITDPRLHSELKSKFKSYYSSGEDEGYTVHMFCAIKNGIYINVHKGQSDIDTQFHAEFSATPPRCHKCKRISKGIESLTSKIGLRIGLSKAAVAKILDVNVKEDINTISFEETLNDGKTNINHMQELRLVFQNDKLINFRISDLREQDN